MTAVSTTYSREISAPASFQIYARPAFSIVVIVSLTLVFGLFALFPGVDIALSALFYDAGTCGEEALCGGFPAAVSAQMAKVRSFFYALPFVVFISILLINTCVAIKTKQSLWRDAPVVGTIIATLLLGPGLLVNVILKQHILRVRPRDVTFFGGELPFVPVGQWDGLCKGNCSFVSGEASIAPLLVLSVLLFPKKWQKPAFFVLLPASLAMALLRVAFGAHFVSDITLGYGLTLAVFSILAFFLTQRTQPNLPATDPKPV